MGSATPGDDGAVVETDADNRYIRFADKLGQGAFKVVYRGIDRDQGLEVAWNQIKLDSSQVDFQKLIKEVKFLKQLSHPNIIVFHNSWVDREKLQVVIITECMTSGTLSNFIKRAGHVKLKVIKAWCLQVLEGLKYLHTQDPPVIHRDIKCDNIFLNGTIGQVKIGDLGLATLHSDGVPLSVIGTPEFMAPELYEEEYDERVDIWSFGMCLLEMATGHYPYRECENAAQIFKRVSSGRMPRGFLRVKDREVKEFLRICLDKAETRLSSSELLEHPFLLIDEDKDNRSIELYSEEEVEAMIATDKLARQEKLQARKKRHAGAKGRRKNDKRGRQQASQVDSSDTESVTESPKPQRVKRENSQDSVSSDKIESNTQVSTTRPARTVQSGRRSVTIKDASKVPRAIKRKIQLAKDEKPTGEETTNTRVRSKSDVSIKAALEEDTKSVLLQFDIMVNETVRGVEFRFFLEKDSPKRVANEMVEMLNLEKEARHAIALEIQEKIELATGKILSVPEDESPTVSREIEVKRTKEVDPRPMIKRVVSDRKVNNTRAKRTVRVATKSPPPDRKSQQNTPTKAPADKATNNVSGKADGESATKGGDADELEQQFEMEKQKLREQIAEVEARQRRAMEQARKKKQEPKKKVTRTVMSMTVPRSRNTGDLAKSSPMKKSGTSVDVPGVQSRPTLRKVNTTNKLNTPIKGQPNPRKSTATSGDMTQIAEKFLEDFVKGHQPEQPEQPNLLLGPLALAHSTPKELPKKPPMNKKNLSAGTLNTSASSSMLRVARGTSKPASPRGAENPFHTLGSVPNGIISPPPGQQTDLLPPKNSDPQLGVDLFGQQTLERVASDGSTASENGISSPGSIPHSISRSLPSDTKFMSDSLLWGAKTDVVDVNPESRRTTGNPTNLPIPAQTNNEMAGHAPDPFSPIRPSEGRSLLEGAHFSLSGASNASQNLNTPGNSSPRASTDRTPASGDNVSSPFGDLLPSGSLSASRVPDLTSPFPTVLPLTGTQETEGQLIKALTTPRLSTEAAGAAPERVTSPPPLSSAQTDLLSPFDISFTKSNAPLSAGPSPAPDANRKEALQTLAHPLGGSDLRGGGTPNGVGFNQSSLGNDFENLQNMLGDS